MTHKFDVVVIGGGHAGCEAAAVAARMGAKTALLTLSLDRIGVMSCNPAIGGLGKGHLVREIDAFDGLMGSVADSAGIQFRLLNRAKGPAVRGPRAQADRKLYRAAMQAALRDIDGLSLLEGEAGDLLIHGGTVQGVTTTAGEDLYCAAVVVTAGTFLRGVIHRGAERTPAGRLGERPAVRLGETLERLGFRMGRLKTGTPPRLDGRSIDWSGLERQKGDDEPEPFSTLTEAIVNPQVDCFITHTNEAAHAVIRANLTRSPLFSGAISGRGPRYCPSIEDKVTRFSDRGAHQIFLEPEGLDDDTIYPNGVSTSLPPDAQQEFLRAIAGLAHVRMIEPGYAIEYDYVDPRELTPGLESKRLPGLFLAGQVNGTTGYEEAGAQGVAAGINAALKAAGSPPRHFSRSESYLGVMIDDLICRGVSEPYRVFTSRAEFRLSLRADNADQRLTPAGVALGCVSRRRRDVFARKAKALDEARALLTARSLTPNEASRHGLAVNQDGQRRSAFDLLALEGVCVETLARIWPELAAVAAPIARQIEIDAKYAVYLDRQAREIAAAQRDEELRLPADFDYERVPGLSNEIRARLGATRPATLGQAGRVEGVTPAALTLLAARLRLLKAAS